MSSALLACSLRRVLFRALTRPPLQIHSTGQDVPQAVDAVAALTIGKDTTYRDLAQVREGAIRLGSASKCPAAVCTSMGSA